MKTFFKLSVVAALVLAPLLAVPARADVLFNNIGLPVLAPFSGADPVSNTLYASFSTSSQGLMLSSLALELDAVTPNDGGLINVVLASDAFGVPGKGLRLLGQINDSILTTSPSVYTFSESVPLAANTRYWIKLAQTAGTSSSAYWAYAGSSAGVGVYSEYDYNTGNSPALSVNSLGLGVYMMTVSAVPEPTSLALYAGALTILGVVASSRRRRS